MERREPNPSQQEYERGREIGELSSKIENLTDLLKDSIKKQDEMNVGLARRISIVETWVQTTSGKVIILTSIFAAVGSIAYLAVNWFLNHKFK